MLRARRLGFTLIEMLVVVAIIAVFIGAALLSIDISGQDRQSEQEVVRLKSLLELLREESLLQGLDYGVHFNRGGYQFYYYDYQQREWLLPLDDGLLAERRIPELLEMSVTVDDRSLVLEAAPDLDDGETAVPQVFVLSSGEMTPFTVDLYRDISGSHFTLTAEFNGAMEIEAFD
jgi:general secretion pathway protein H